MKAIVLPALLFLVIAPIGGTADPETARATTEEKVRGASTDAPREGAPTTIKAPALFRTSTTGEHFTYTYLVLTDRTQSFQIKWSCVWGQLEAPQNFYNFGLESGETYTFTIVERTRSAGPRGIIREDIAKVPPRTIRIPEIARVMQGEKTIYDREVCEVHQHKMEQVKVRIVYGFLSTPPKSPTAAEMKTLFPHFTKYILGGGLVGPNSDDLVFNCPECKAAREKWDKENGVKK